MEGGFNDYQVRANEAAVYSKAIADAGYNEALRVHRLSFVALGLTGEAGEVANKVKKILRDNGGVVSPEARSEIADELGDVLWYLSQACTEIDVTLAEVAKNNIVKIKSRHAAGTSGGSGDGR